MRISQEQTQLIYAALMSYGNKLSDMAKEIPNEDVITDKMGDKAKMCWHLARTMINNGEDE